MEEAARPPAGASFEQAQSTATGWSLHQLRRLWSQFRPTLGSAARHNPVWGSCVIALLLDGELRADLFMACADHEDEVTVANTVLRWITKGYTTIGTALEEPHDTDPRLRLYKKFLEHPSVGFERWTGEKAHVIVHAEGRAKVNLPEFFDLLAGAKVEAVEVKDYK